MLNTYPEEVGNNFVATENIAVRDPFRKIGKLKHGIVYILVLFAIPSNDRECLPRFNTASNLKSSFEVSRNSHCVLT
jgi:hypothetical protein